MLMININNKNRGIKNKNNWGTEALVKEEGGVTFKITKIKTSPKKKGGIKNFNFAIN